MFAGRTAAVAVGLLVPRIVRMAYGEIWIEDEAYLDLGQRIARGEIPYRDFVLPHFPLLEALLGALFRVFGTGLRVAELANNLALWLAALLLYRALEREGKPLLGFLAAAFFSLSSLGFRFHLWEREVLSQPILAGALLLLARGALPPAAVRGRRLALAALLVLSALVKLTNLVFWLALGLHLLVDRRDARSAATLWITGATGVALLLLAGTAVFGSDLPAQLFLIHLAKGAGPAIAGKLDTVAESLNLLLGFGLLGIPLLLRRERRWGGLCLWWLACEGLFHLGLKTFWPHNAIDALIPLSIASAAAGLFLGELLAEGRPRGRAALAGAAVALWLGVWLAWLAPPTARTRGAVYGFGFQPRQEIERAADAIRAHSDPGDRVVAPALLAVAADRAKLVAYREQAGAARRIRELTAWGGWRELLSARPRRGFVEQVARGSGAWRREIAGAVRGRRVAVVVNDVGRHHYPQVSLPARLLRESGYRRVLASPSYEVWARSDEP